MLSVVETATDNESAPISVQARRGARYRTSCTTTTSPASTSVNVREGAANALRVRTNWTAAAETRMTPHSASAAGMGRRVEITAIAAAATTSAANGNVPTPC